MVLDVKLGFAYIRVSARHARYELELVDPRRDSNLRCAMNVSEVGTLTISSRAFRSPGSNRIRRLAPMRLMPHPPALLLRRKTNFEDSGSLNSSTILPRLAVCIEPSSRSTPQLIDGVSIRVLVSDGVTRENVPPGPTHVLEEVERLGEITDKHDLLFELGVDTMQESSMCVSVSA